MVFEGMEKLDLNVTEYCFLREDTSHYSPTFKIFIPKLMPHYGVAEIPIVITESISNVFINDPSNRPTPSTSISTQNFVTLQRLRNSWFRLHPDIFKWKTKFVCRIIDNNIRNIWLIDDEFNEDYVPPHPVYVRNPSFEILDKINVGDTVKYSYDPDPTIDVNDNNDVTTIIEDSSVNSMLVSADGVVTAKNDWGLVVNKIAVTPDRILGFYKKPGEYYSYY